MDDPKSRSTAPSYPAYAGNLARQAPIRDLGEIEKVELAVEVPRVLGSKYDSSSPPDHTWNPRDDFYDGCPPSKIVR